MNQPDIEPGQQRSLIQALHTIRLLREKLANYCFEPIAVVGLACRTPGADCAEDFWRLLVERGDAVGEIPADRWDNAHWYHPDPQLPGKLASRWGGTLAADRFDPEFFGIPFDEAQQMDPQQRVLLEVAWEAVESAGMTTTDLSGSQTGVFVGAVNYNGDYARHVFANRRRVNALSGPAVAYSVMAGRLAYLFDLKGPNLAIDTACSSSLTALHMACQSLRQRECDTALAGGVNMILAPDFTLATSRMNLMAKDGRCKPFDARADGIARSDGCGVVVLKRWSDAQRNGDRVLAVIRGSAVNQDGRTNGLTAPNGQAQSTLIKLALARAQAVPSDLGYIEAHGTGTALGDPIEIAAISAVLEQSTCPEPCWVGSVKGNVGHCEAAAGILSFIKVVLSLRHGCIPPQANLGQINAHIDLSRGRVAFPRKMTPWPMANGRQKCAGVSSFGWSGTNAHVILGPAPADTPKDTLRPSAFILPLSAITETRLRARVDRLAEHIEQQQAGGEAAVADLCYTAGARRTHYAYRQAFVGKDAGELLLDINRWRASARSADQPAPEKMAVIFGGQGEQWPGMVDELMAAEPAFYQQMMLCEQEVRSLAGWSLMAAIGAGGQTDLSATQFAQPCLVAIQISLFRMLTDWGITPTAVAGHSVGEFSAACCAGILSLKQTLTAVIARGSIMESMRARGQMIAVNAAPEQLAKLLSTSAGAVVAAINGPHSTVLAVEAAQVANIRAMLEHAGLTLFAVNDYYAFHGPQVDDLREPLTTAFSPLAPAAADLMLVSTAVGARVESSVMDADYWFNHARGPVKFSAAIACLYDAGISRFLELGPGSALTPQIKRCLHGADRPVSALGLLQRGKAQYGHVLRCIAALYNAVQTVNWPALQRNRGNMTCLPGPLWQHRRCWIPLTPPQPPAGNSPSLAGEMIAPALNRLSFRAQWSEQAQPLLADHHIFDHLVVPGAVHIAMVATQICRYLEDTRVSLTNVVFIQPWVSEPHICAIACLRFSPHPQGADLIAFTLDADRETSGPERKVLSTGTIDLLADDRRPTQPPWTLPACLAALDPLNLDDFYQRAHAAGLQLGKTFRALTGLWWENAGAKGAFTLANRGGRDGGSSLVIDPGALDCCFQAMFALYWRLFPASELFIPLSIDRLRFCQLPWTTLSGQIIFTSPLTAGVETLTGDILLYADNGDCVAVMQQVTLKRVSRPALLNGLSAPINPLHRYEWQELTCPPATQPWTGEIRLISRDSQYAQAFADALALVGPRPAVVVLAGDADRDLAGLSGNLFYLAESEGADDCFSAQDRLEDALRSFSDLVHLANALARAGGEGAPRLWVITRQTQLLPGDAQCALTSAGLWGLCRTIAQEYPAIFGAIIDIAHPALPAANGMAHFHTILGSGAGTTDYLLHHNRLYAPRVIAVAVADAPSPVQPRRNGSYLITGGFSAAGRALADRLFTQGAGGVMLMSRSVPSAELIALAQDHRRQGKLLCLFQGDVAHLSDVQAALRALDRQLPALAGVFHLAGVLEDAVLARVDKHSAQRVFRPKINGAWNVHLATANRPLECFTLFSSLSATVGTPGQAAYAAANAFMDGLARYRVARGLAATAIAWGPWQGGMTLGLDSDQRQRLAARGIGLLDPASIPLWATRWQGQDCTHCILAAIDPPSLPALLRRGATPLRAEVSPAANAPATPDIVGLLRSMPNQDARQAAMVKWLMEQVGSLVAVEGFDGATPLQSLGLDSLNAVAIVQNIRAQMALSIPITLLFDSCHLNEVAVKLAGILAAHRDK